MTEHTANDEQRAEQQETARAMPWAAFAGGVALAVAGAGVLVLAFIGACTVYDGFAKDDRAAAVDADIFCDERCRALGRRSGFEFNGLCECSYAALQSQPPPPCSQTREPDDDCVPELDKAPAQVPPPAAADEGLGWMLVPDCEPCAP